jgi:hypothetical protein
MAIVEKNNHGRVIIKNLQTNSAQGVNVNLYQPLLSITIDAPHNVIYFLGKLNTRTAETTLYYSPLNEIKITELGTQKATRLELLSSPHLLLFARADMAGKSRVSVYDQDKRQSIIALDGDSYAISPNRDRLALLDQNTITTLNLSDLTPYPQPALGTTHLIWATNDQLALIRNGFPGVSVTYFNPQTKQLASPQPIPELNQISLNKLIGLINGTLFAYDQKGYMWQIILPSP